MKLRKLKIADTYSAPVSFIHSTLGCFGKRGSGKSHAGQLHAEQLLEMGVQIVALDPVGAWWGLRASADGKGPGFPIIVFGGEHGDVPLDPAAGEVLAIAIAEHGFSCVIDLSLMRKGERLRFCADFLETLYRVNREAMHLFIDEADAVAPQRPIDPQQARCLGAADELVRRGRQRGIGCTLISQRPQVVNKDLLSQVDQLLVLRLSHPKDIGAIDAWISDHVDPKRAREMLDSLPALDVGEGWIWAPDLHVFERVRINAKSTYDSGRTPKPGERIRPPKKLAAVDLKLLGEAMSASVEEVKERDPKSLRAALAETRAELEKVRASKVKTKVVERRPIISEALGKKLLSALGHVEHAKKKLESRLTVGDAYADEVRIMLARALGLDARAHQGAKLAALTFPGQVHVRVLSKEEAEERDRQMAKLPQLDASGYTGGGKSPRRVGFNEAMAELRENRAPKPPASKPAEGLTAPQQRILDAIAQLNGIGVAAPTRGQVAWMAGGSPNASGFERNLSVLRTAKLIEYPEPGKMHLLGEGRAKAAKVERPMTEPEFHHAVRQAVTGPQWKILEVFIAHRGRLSRPEVAERAGASVNASGFERNLSVLRGLGLIEYPAKGVVAPGPNLFPGGAQ